MRMNPLGIDGGVNQMRKPSTKFAGKFHLTGEAADTFLKVQLPDLYQQNLDSMRLSNAAIDRWFMPEFMKIPHRQKAAPRYEFHIEVPNDSEAETNIKETVEGLSGYYYQRFKDSDPRNAEEPTVRFVNHQAIIR